MDFLSFSNLLSQSYRRRRGIARPEDRNIEVVVVGTVSQGNGQEARELIRGKKDYILTPPVPRNPEVWERLKDAHSAFEVRQVALRIDKKIPTTHWRALHTHADDFLGAKKLHSYPKSDRPRSDEKRIHFVAKVISGFMQDIAPTTALKRLARLSLPNTQDIQKSVEEAAMWDSKPEHRKSRTKRLIALERGKGSSQWWNVYQDETDRIWREPVEREIDQ
jgi:hypothetical protein